MFHYTRGIAQNPRGIAQNPRWVAINPRGVGQICQLNLLIKIIFVFYPRGIAQNPRGVAQNPRGVAQNPRGYPPGCSMFFTSLTLPLFSLSLFELTQGVAKVPWGVAIFSSLKSKNLTLVSHLRFVTDDHPIIFDLSRTIIQSSSFCHGRSPTHL